MADRRNGRPIQLRLDEMLTNQCKQVSDSLEELRIELAKLRQIDERDQRNLELAMDTLTKVAERGVWFADPVADLIEE